MRISSEWRRSHFCLDAFQGLIARGFKQTQRSACLQTALDLDRRVQYREALQNDPRR